MAREFTPKVVTANRLLEGDVVYMGCRNEWVLDITDAKLFTDEDVANTALAYGSGLIDELVGVYLMDAAVIDGKTAPTHFREDFRATGPSNYRHGKQAELETYNV
jgi:hypothetical protein